MKNILVDMSAVLLHHGHVRLLKKASKFGKVIVALTTDTEIKKKKKINPELNFNQRKEILSSIKYVSKVIPSPWNIDNEFLTKNKIDLVVHGNDNKNNIMPKKLKLFIKTKNISTSNIRKRCYQNYRKKFNL